MTAKKGEKWWLTLLVACLPAIIAGMFGWQAKETADKTAGEVAVTYALVKQSLEILQHEADGYRESLQHTNDLLVRLLQQKQQRSAEETAILTKAEELNVKLSQPPPERPKLPSNVQDIVNSKTK